MSNFKDFVDTMKGAIEIFKSHDLCKSWMAVDSNDKPCAVMSENAQKFSVTGAVLKVCRLNTIPQHHLSTYVIEFLETHSGYDSLTQFNDSEQTTKCDAVYLLKVCIQRIYLAWHHQRTTI